MTTIKDILVFDPLPWQERALEKFNKLTNDIKLLQKLGGAGKTYFCVYYALKKYGENAKIAVIASPNQHLSWKKTFKNFPVDYISTGIINKKDYFKKDFSNNYDIILFDEVDSHFKNLKSNTYKNFKKIKKKECILLSATLLAGDYVNSMNYLKMLGWKEKQLKPYFRYTKNYNIPQYIKSKTKQDHILVNEGINKEAKLSYENIFKSYGYVELEKLHIYETEINEIKKDKRKENFEFNLEKVVLESPKVLEEQKNIIKYSYIETTDYLVGKTYEKYNLLLNVSVGVVPNNFGNFEIIDKSKFLKVVEIIKKFNLKQVFIFYNNAVERDILKDLLEKEGKKVYLNQEAKNIKEDEEFILLGHYTSIGRGLDFKELQSIILLSPTETYEEFKQALFRLGRESSIYKHMYIWEIFYNKTLHQKIFEKQNKFENFDKNKFLKKL